MVEAEEATLIRLYWFTTLRAKDAISTGITDREWNAPFRVGDASFLTTNIQILFGVASIPPLRSPHVG